MKHRVAIIMAGGSGERFWPLSRKTQPKQMLSLTSDKPMIAEAVDRILSVFRPEDIYVITSRLLAQPLRDVLPELPVQNVIAEPGKRNTAPCLALALQTIIAERACEPEELTCAVLTADHFIRPATDFCRCILAALHHVEREPVLATIGIPPQRPETGFGYIEVQPHTVQSDRPEAVISFREKPNYDQALDFIRCGNFYWNSGMFFWRADTFFDALRLHYHVIGDKLADMQRAVNHQRIAGSPTDLEHVFMSMPDISVDYAVMERAENVVMFLATFYWDDIGSWDALTRLHPTDLEHNVAVGKSVLVDCTNVISVNKASESPFVVTALGMSDCVIVVTDDAAMVCPRSRAQEVRRIVSGLRDAGGELFL